MNVKDTEAKVDLFELVDEKKLGFKKLDLKSRIGVVKQSQIVSEVTLT